MRPCSRSHRCSRVDASALFADRAGGAGCRLDTADDEVRQQVDQLCAAVDRLPLAIEMAANRLRVFQLPELVERMDDRDALLRSPVRSELSTRGTMQATIDWSYSLLVPAEQAMFGRLAMFPAGCAATAAEAVCHVDGDDFEVDEVVDLVARLVDRSLVVADHSTSPTRFRMLDTIRHFAAARLAERPDAGPVEDAYIEWATRMAIGAAAGLRTAEQGMWRTTVEAELDNLRVAFERAVAAGRVEALEMANAALGAAAYVWRDRLERGVAAPGAERHRGLGLAGARAGRHDRGRQVGDDDRGQPTARSMSSIPPSTSCAERARAAAG